MKWKTTIITVILNFALMCDYAESVPLNDTLKLLTMPDDTAKCNLLIDLSETYHKSNTEKGLYYGNQGLDLSRKLNYKSGIARSYKLIGTNLWISGIYDIALDNYLNSLKLYKELKDTISLCKVYNNIGLIYFARTEPKLASENYSIGLKLAKLVKSDSEQARILTNMALLEREHGSVEKAINYHYEGLKYATLCNDPFTIAYNKCFIGKCYNSLKKYDSVSKFFDESLSIFDSINSSKDVAMLYNQYAEHYIDIKNYEKALEYANKGLELSKSIGSGYTELESNLLISNTYKCLKNYEQALLYKSIYTDLAFKMINESTIKSISQIEAKHKYEEKMYEAKIQSQRKLSKSREFLKIAVIVVTVLLLMLSFLILFYRFKVKNNHLLTIKNKEITDLNSQLRELNASKDKFFSIIAHDLKNPLGTFKNITNMMHESSESFTESERADLIKLMEESAGNVYTLLENLLEWSMSQRGKIIFSPVEIELKYFTESTINIINPLAQAKNTEITNKIPKSIFVKADENMLNTVIRNLLSNAVKFTPKGGKIEIGITETKSSDDYTTIYVRDTGIGMSEDIIDKLFRIDETVTSLGTEGEKGTGLGLILCKEFVEKHGGKIWVESEEGKGSTFYFSL